MELNTMTNLLTLSLTSTKQNKSKRKSPKVQKSISFVNFESELCKLKIYTFCAP